MSDARLFIDDDGDACLLPEGSIENLVALPARDEDGHVMHEEAWQLMVQRFNLYPALLADRDRLAAALDAQTADRDRHRDEAIRLAARVEELERRADHAWDMVAKADADAARCAAQSLEDKMRADRLAAEVERLREALEQISDAFPLLASVTCRDIARAALQGD